VLRASIATAAGLVALLPSAASACHPQPTPAHGCGHTDTVAPTASVELDPRAQTLDGVLRHGLLLRARCSEKCRVRTRLLITRRTAQRLHILGSGSLVVLGAGSGTLQGAGALSYRVQLRRRPKARLRSICEVRTRLQTIAVDAARNETLVERSLTLRRSC
jgi:hypothetical protein